jgi:ABC-type anion transport system duplicated permease subunit
MINIFEAMMYSLIWMLLNLSLTLIMRFFIPKHILKNYFKEPYFSAMEINMFSGFPFLGFTRTVMFMRLLAFPSCGKKRGIENAYKTAPVWICKLSKFHIISTVASILSLLFIQAVFGIRLALGWI